MDLERGAVHEANRLWPFFIIPGAGFVVFLVLSRGKPRLRTTLSRWLLGVIALASFITVASLFEIVWIGLFLAHFYVVATFGLFFLTFEEFQLSSRNHGSAGKWTFCFLGLATPLITMMLFATLGNLSASKLDTHYCSTPMQVWGLVAAVTSIAFVAYVQSLTVASRPDPGTLFVRRGGDIGDLAFYMIAASVFCLILPFFYTKLANPILVLGCLLH